MSKTINKRIPKAGTNTAIILEYILEHDVKVSDIQDLVNILYLNAGIDTNRKRVNECIQRFNKGWYIVNGEDVDTHGKINVLSPKTAVDTSVCTMMCDGCDTSCNNAPNTDSELEQGVLDLNDIKTQVKGGKIKTGWFTLPSGEKVMISPDAESDDALKAAEEEIKAILDDAFWDVKYTPTVSTDSNNGEGVVFISDLHIGALVKDLIKTPNYNKEVVKEKLLKAAEHVNRMGFDKVHVASLGDIIHSYTGTNHKNTWKGLEIGEHGPAVIKTAVNIIHEFFLSRLKNLYKVYMVAGNHCRTTQSKEEETQGGASNLVAFVLEKMGYNVEFDVKCISTQIDDIQYILLHGDQGISKRPTKDIIWDFGQQGKFNFIAEGHLHSRIQRLTPNSRDKFKIITDDSNDCRRHVMPSIFTGDEYSESNLWFSSSGFVVCSNNGEGKPIVIDIPL